MNIGKVTKAVLTVIAFSVLALPVKAEEKVWYCEMNSIAESSMIGTETFRTEKFKMKVTQEKVVYGSGGYFDDNEHGFSFFGNQNYWHAASEFSITSFHEGRFYYASVTDRSVIAISARCEDF